MTGGERPDPAIYMGYTPPAALALFKKYLTETERGILTFGFSDSALLRILDAEFDVDLERQVLVFRKAYLDAQSIRLASDGRSEGSFSTSEQALVDNLADWLLEATRSLYRGDLSAERLSDIRAEYAENFRVYARKCVPDYDPEGVTLLLRSLFASVKAMSAFCHSLTVDAMFKADATRVLFGEESSYYQAWFRKQIFRHMMCKAVDQYVTSCLA